MEDFKKRLQMFIECHFQSVRAFEQACDLTNGTIGSIGPQGPSVANLSKISYGCPELNMNWLFRGDDGGPMLNAENDKKKSPARVLTPTNDIHNNNMVIIGNWAELGEVVEKAVSKAMSNK